MAEQDNAGIYQLTPSVAVVQTVDFFTPVVDDPFSFGQIAAANSLSDVYAMGGKPVTAMNIVGFPISTMDVSVLRDILRGGAEKMVEAGVVLIGGHSVDDPELKYGLSVTGTVHPKKFVTNGGAQPGDRLILTKPLGTGIIATALKAGKTGKADVARITKQMSTLNKAASETMMKVGVHACTDITGFGFIGHTAQVAANSGVGIKIKASAVPLIPGVMDYAKQGFYAGGLGRNRDYYGAAVKVASGLTPQLEDILYDPQTSGGLLISVAAAKATLLLSRLHNAGVTDAMIIGEVVARPKGKIIIEP